MRHFGRIAVLSLAFLVSVSTFFLRGQELPSLPKAPEVVTSSLPNGIQYYLVKNTASSGFADFALVQKGRTLSQVVFFNTVLYGYPGTLSRIFSIFRNPSHTNILPNLASATRKTAMCAMKAMLPCSNSVMCRFPKSVRGIRCS